MIFVASTSGWLRRQDRLLLVALIAAVTVFVLGTLLGILVGALVCSLGRKPSTHRWYVLAPSEIESVLWLDGSRVVLGKPWRVVYRDELTAGEYCRLRRFCLGLPE